MALDPTLTQILSALYEAHETIDQLRAQVAALQTQVEHPANGVTIPDREKVPA